MTSRFLGGMGSASLKEKEKLCFSQMVALLERILTALWGRAVKRKYGVDSPKDVKNKTNLRGLFSPWKVIAKNSDFFWKNVSFN